MDNRFIITCNHCAWKQPTTGVSTDLQAMNLFEIKKCTNCGGPRKFRCPKCGHIAKMVRTKGNDR